MYTPIKPLKDDVVATTVEQAKELAGNGEQSVVLVNDNVQVTQISHALLADGVNFAALNWGAPAIEREVVIAAFGRGELDVLVVVNHPDNGFIEGRAQEITVLVPAMLEPNEDQARSRLARAPH